MEEDAGGAVLSKSDDDQARAMALEEYKFYLEERKSFNQAELDACESFDKYMITLASGALGISVLFMEKVAKTPRPESYPVLITSWVLFGLCLSGMLASFLFSQFSWRKQRLILDVQQCLKGGHEPPPVPPGLITPWVADRLRDRPKLDRAVRRCWDVVLRIVDRENHWSSLTKWLNSLCLVFFILGVFLSLVFCASNLPRQGYGSMAGPEPKPGGDEKTKGLPSRPPAAPPPFERGAPARPASAPPPSTPPSKPTGK